MKSRRSGDSLERAWPPAATGSGEVSVDSELCDEGEFTHTKSMTKIAMEGSERASHRLARRVPRGGVSGRRRKWSLSVAITPCERGDGSKKGPKR